LLLLIRECQSGETARVRLQSNEWDELKEHGLKPTANPLIFEIPMSLFVPSLWFIRTNHSWYWTSSILWDIENETAIKDCNWSVIRPDEDIRAIGGFWHGQMPASRNIVLIEWLIGTGFPFLH
jgi:hypothetical protein